VPGLGRVRLGANCIKLTKQLLEAASATQSCLLLLLNPEFVREKSLSLFDIFTALITVCTLRARGQATARKPYIEALMLLARSRNIGEVLEKNRLQEGANALLAYCCPGNRLDLPELIAGECKLPLLEPRNAGEMLVFAVDAKIFRKTFEAKPTGLSGQPKPRNSRTDKDSQQA